MGVLAPGSAHAWPSAQPPINTGRGSNKLGQGESPKFIFTSKLFFFCDSKPHAKFHNRMITPSGRKVIQAERKRKTSWGWAVLSAGQTGVSKSNCNQKEIEELLITSRIPFKKDLMWSFNCKNIEVVLHFLPFTKDLSFLLFWSSSIY